MFLHKYPYMNEEAGGLESGGAGEGPAEAPAEGAEATPAPETFLRDIDEETAYNTLMSAQQFPDNLRGLESRLFGSMGPLKEQLNQLSKSVGTQTSFNTDRVKEALNKYDETGALAEALVPALAEAFQVNPLDESTLAPYLSPMQEQVQKQMGEAVVLSHYSPERIAEIIPDVQDGKFDPQSQTQKDFVTWYAQQGYSTHEALNTFGPQYVQSLKRFEKWADAKTKERAEATGAKSSRLAGGQPPSGNGTRPKASGPQTAEEAMLAGYNSVD